MLENILWGLGVILVAFLVPLVVYIVTKTAGNLAKPRRPPGVVTMRSSFEDMVNKAMDELRNTQGMQQTQIQDLAHGVQLMKQEWTDFYEKTRRSEDRTRKAIKASSDRDEDNGDREITDQLLLQVMQQQTDQDAPASEDVFARAERLRPRGQ